MESLGEQGLAQKIPGDFEGSGKAGKFEEEEKPENMKSVKDVLADRKSKTLLHKPDTVKGLEFVWKKAYSEKYQTFAPAFTNKQFGQLKMFMGKCPPGAAGRVLATVLGDWVPFVKTVEKQAGVKTLPTRPQIAFLLQHAGVAVSMALPKSKPVEQGASPGVVTPAAVQSIACQKPEEDKPKTFAELMAIIGEEPETKAK